MPFKKGQSGNPAGRRKGANSKDTQAIREKFRKFIEDNLETITEDFQMLKEPKDRLYFITHIAEYVLPKLQRTEIASDPDNPVEVNLTDDQLKRYIKQVFAESDG